MIAGICGYNNFEWPVVDFACALAGLVSCGIHTTSDCAAVQVHLNPSCCVVPHGLLASRSGLARAVLSWGEAGIFVRLHMHTRQTAVGTEHDILIVLRGLRAAYTSLCAANMTLIVCCPTTLQPRQQLCTPHCVHHRPDVTSRICVATPGPHAW